MHWLSISSLELNICSQPDVATEQRNASCGSVQVEQRRFDSACKARHKFQSETEKRPESVLACRVVFLRQVTLRDPAFVFQVA